MGVIMPTVELKETGMSSLTDYWHRYRRTRGLTRELWALGVCLSLGLVLMPILIWLVGSWKLGPYSNGGLLALWRDFFAALIKGSLAYWLVAAGPYAALWLLRAARFALRR